MEYQVFPKWNTPFVTYRDATFRHFGIVCLIMWKHTNGDITKGDNGRYSMTEYIK